MLRMASGKGFPNATPAADMQLCKFHDIVPEFATSEEQERHLAVILASPDNSSGGDRQAYYTKVHLHLPIGSSVADR